VALVYVDDATSRLMQLHFAESESTFDYFEATRGYLEQHGRPVAFYSGKAGVFRVNAKQPKGGDGTTQFARAMGELNIDILCANSPQAKGRVERAHLTLQDRLTKELRLRGGPEVPLRLGAGPARGGGARAASQAAHAPAGVAGARADRPTVLGRHVAGRSRVRSDAGRRAATCVP
jgi:hypothetical protein